MKDKFNSAFQGFCVAACVLLMLAACKQPDNSDNTPPPKKWAVTVQYDKDCGTASAAPNPAEMGAKVTLTAEPKSTHKFKEWKLVSGDVVIYSINTNPATFTMPGNDVTIMAEFEILADITLEEVIYGFEQPAKKSIPVANLGIDSQTVKNIVLGADNESPFVLDEQDLKNKITVGNVLNFLVQPKAGLKAGTYIDTVIVTHGSGKTAVFTIGITVKQKPVTISGITANDRDYDGTTRVTLTGTATMSGIIGSDDVKLNTGEASFEDKNAGTDKAVILSGFTLSGADAGNYTLPQIKANILPKSIRIFIYNTDFTMVPFGAAEVKPAESSFSGKYRQNGDVKVVVQDLVAGETVLVSVKKNDYGLSGSIETGDGECTLTMAYDGTKVDPINDIIVVLDVGSNYQLPPTAAFKISIRDGLAPDRWIPLAKGNLEDFLVYVNTANGLNKHYKLIENITLTTPPAGGSNWTAIGTVSRPFTGSFDGGGKVINNLTNSQGMFNYIGKDGVVENTALVSGSIIGTDVVGGLAGTNYGMIQNCYTTANVSGVSYVGGLVGTNNGIIQNCYTTGNVNGENHTIGGVVGRNSKTVQNCYAMGKISGLTEVGGIAGSVDNGEKVENCAALNFIVTVKENSSSNVNRVIGFCNDKNKILNNHARGDMFVKYNWNGSTGKDKTISDVSDSMSYGGQSMISMQYRVISWWKKESSNWSGDAWDFANTWQMNTYNLPKLKGAGGDQGHILQINPAVVEMVQVTAGSFVIGTPIEEVDDGRITSDERPQSTISLSSFYIGKYQITQEQYSVVMGINPSYYNGESGKKPATWESQEKRPVEQISWYDAIVFCNLLSMAVGLSPAYSISGSTNPANWGTVPTIKNNTWDAVQTVSGSDGYRLPTEAQWEYACRAGTVTAYNNDDKFPPTKLSTVAWYSGNSGGITHEVGRLQPNAWGLYDMHGNVREWCWDYFTYNYNTITSQNPTGPTNGDSRVIRGGSYRTDILETRSAARGYSGSIDSDIGLRLVRPAP